MDRRSGGRPDALQAAQRVVVVPVGSPLRSVAGVPAPELPAGVVLEARVAVAEESVLAIDHHVPGGGRERRPVLHHGGRVAVPVVPVRRDVRQGPAAVRARRDPREAARDVVEEAPDLGGAAAHGLLALDDAAQGVPLELAGQERHPAGRGGGGGQLPEGVVAEGRRDLPERRARDEPAVRVEGQVEVPDPLDEAVLVPVHVHRRPVLADAVRRRPHARLAGRELVVERAEDHAPLDRPAPRLRDEQRPVVNEAHPVREAGRRPLHVHQPAGTVVLEELLPLGGLHALQATQCIVRQPHGGPVREEDRDRVAVLVVLIPRRRRPSGDRGRLVHGDPPRGVVLERVRVVRVRGLVLGRPERHQVTLVVVGEVRLGPLEVTRLAP